MVIARVRRATRAVLTPMLVLALLSAVVALTSCNPAPPTFHAGTYTSSIYHFSVQYPRGWHVNVSPESSKTIPLAIIITQSGGTPAGNSVSTFSVTVFNANADYIAASIAKLPKDPTLHSTIIGGHNAYASQPQAQQVPGGTETDTHTDYYVVVGSWEYQLSTDAISGAKAENALQQMLASFTITG